MRRALPALAGPLLAMMASVGSAHGQSSPPQAGVAADDPFKGFSTSIDISTEEDKAKSTFALSGYFPAKPRGSGDGGRRMDTSWKLGLAIPIGGKSDLLDKGTLENLGDGTKLSAGITLLSFKSNPLGIFEPGIQPLMKQAKEACRNKAKDDAARATCDALEPAEHVIKDNAPWLTLQMNRALYGGFWTLGAEGAVSTANYKYIQGPALDEKKQRELGYSAKLAFNYYFDDAASKFKLEAEYSDAAEAADTAIICKPVVAVPANDCKSGAPSAPSRESALVLRMGNARYFPFRNGKAGIGVELTGSKDLLSKDWAVEAPVYVTIPGITAISPGVKFSYGSKDGEKDFTANLFIKTAFSF